MALSSEVETGIYPLLQEALCLILGISFEKDLASPPPPLSVGRTSCSSCPSADIPQRLAAQLRGAAV